MSSDQPARRIAPIGPGRVAFHTAGLAVLSLLISGNGNVLPQLFFQRHDPTHKVLWLAICLLIGAIAATAGVLTAKGRPGSHTHVFAILVATLLAELALFRVHSGYVYVAVNGALQFGANHLVNQLDHLTVARAGDLHRRLNDGLSNLARLLGMLSAPLFYTATYAHRAVLFSVLVALALLALASTAMVFVGGMTQHETLRGDGEARPADRSDRMFFAYAIAVYAALYLLAANLIYLLRDVVRLDGPERRGGTTLTAVFAAAVVGNLAAATLGGRRQQPRMVRLLTPAFMLAVVATLFGAVHGLSFAAVVAGGASIGFAYGFFLFEVREYASRGARLYGKTVLLTYFNNMANLSSLVAFVAMTAIAALGRGPATYAIVLTLIALLPFAGAPLLFAARASWLRTGGLSGGAP